MPCVLHQVDWTHRFTLIEHCTTAYSTAFVMVRTYQVLATNVRSNQGVATALDLTQLPGRWRSQSVGGSPSWLVFVVGGM